jgi:energy-coupling factor transporter ATP-binding protein EcfA2
MKHIPIDIHKYQTRHFDISKTSDTINMRHIWTDKNTDINEFYLFMTHFNAIPNYISQVAINCNKATDWLLKQYAADIVDVYYNKRCFRSSKTAELDDVFVFLYEDLIVNFDTNCEIVRFLFRETEAKKVEEILEGVKKFRANKDRQSRISLLVQGSGSIETERLKISKPKLSIKDNYNDDFIAVHKAIIKRLSKNYDKGMVLLHGKPGTGKTSYIRYLISILKKEVIFLPPSMASAITNPNLIATLIHSPNSIFVIEDAENIIIDREREGNSPVSALLNLSDGLLSDCLNIQIICSFNTDLDKIDKALMRKGRLIASYEFKELAVAKANALSKKLGYNTLFTSPKTLTDVYNQDEETYQVERKLKAIGF